MQTLFAALDNLENLLSQNDWLVGKRFTEVDIGLFTTLVHFDSVYYRHFKCNLRRLVDYLNHWNHTKRIYNISSIATTVNFKHIKNITTAATRPLILQVSFLSDQIWVGIFKKRH
ncbi:putative glutathione S-transferase [Streptococcus mutans 5SM3]|nr:glutathione S-transferase C-terminal domain-containing protein [Streptococcus mutans]EMB79227.1 putative glutathione S-transferase [Streptococcus mutans 5SM3]MCB4978046.1 glutathione S-transferase C-terminal domain-containing protein [Streptococcus mutans]